MQYRTLGHTHLINRVVRAYSLFFCPETPRVLQDARLATASGHTARAIFL